jgi:hypothetical protein
LPASAQNLSNAVSVAYNPPFTNAVSTNVQAKLSQTVSVKDFGAKGDGTTNDTTAIQNAINAISSAGGGIVNFPFTTNGYLCSSNLTVSSNVTLLGQGQVTLNLTSSSTPNIAIAGSNVTINNLKIIGLGTEIIAWSNTNISNTTIENCWIYNVPGAWTSVMIHCNTTGITNTTIQNNTISGGKYGILFDSSCSGNQLLISNNFIYGNKCIEMNTTYTGGLGNYSLFTDTIIEGNILNASQANGSSDSFAIGIAKGNRILVSNNIIQDGYFHCIHVEDYSLDIVIDGNDIIQTHAGYDGIHIIAVNGGPDPTHVLVTNNLIRFNNSGTSTAFGIGVYYGSDGTSPFLVNIQNNQVQAFSVGIQFGGYTVGTVTGNIVYLCGTGIYATNASPQIYNNEIVSCTTTGLGCTNPGILGKVTFQGSLPTNLFGCASGTIINGFSVPFSYSHTGGSTQYTNVMNAPSAILSQVSVFASNGTNRSSGIHNLSWNGTTSTTTNLINVNNGTMNSAQAQVASSHLQVGCFSTPATTVSGTLELESTLII